MDLCQPAVVFVRSLNVCWWIQQKLLALGVNKLACWKSASFSNVLFLVRLGKSSKNTHALAQTQCEKLRTVDICPSFVTSSCFVSWRCACNFDRIVWCYTHSAKYSPNLCRIRYVKHCVAIWLTLQLVAANWRPTVFLCLRKWHPWTFWTCILSSWLCLVTLMRRFIFQRVLAVH